MRFLFRMGFWLTVVVLLLPSGGSHPSPSTMVIAGDAISAAMATLADARTFCERQPEACVIGSQTATAIGHRAQAGAKLISRVQLYCELQRDWAREATVPGFMDVFESFDGFNPEKAMKARAA